MRLCADRQQHNHGDESSLDRVRRAQVNHYPLSCVNPFHLLSSLSFTHSHSLLKTILYPFSTFPLHSAIHLLFPSNTLPSIRPLSLPHIHSHYSQGLKNACEDHPTSESAQRWRKECVYWARRVSLLSPVPIPP